MDTGARPALLTRAEFFVSDLDRTIEFYARLGFTQVRRWEGWALVDRGGSRLGLQRDAYARDHEHYFTPHLDRFPRGVGVEVSIDVADEDDLRQLYATAQAMGCAVRELVKRGWGAT
ncbi:MAG: VOC family protein, partial [Candidatus Limnocylindria bacterium]